MVIRQFFNSSFSVLHLLHWSNIFLLQIFSSFFSPFFFSSANQTFFLKIFSSIGLWSQKWIVATGLGSDLESYKNINNQHQLEKQWDFGWKVAPKFNLAFSQSSFLPPHFPSEEQNLSRPRPPLVGGGRGSKIVWAKTFLFQKWS